MTGSFTYVPGQDRTPVGAVVYSMSDLERLYPGKFILMDGSIRPKSILPGNLKDTFLAHPQTHTARTMLTSPNGGVATYGNKLMAVSPTYFVAKGDSAGGVQDCLQYSTDGVTWSKTSVSLTSGFDLSGIVWTGTRFIACSSGSTQPQVTTGDNPNSTWTACTGASVGAQHQTLIYSPQLGMAVHFREGVLTSLSSMPDGSSTWTSRTLPTPNNNETPKINAAVWTGERFLVGGQYSGPRSCIWSSTNGTSWTLEKVQVALFMTGGGVAYGAWATDGNGTVVSVMNAGYGIGVSKDHGATWRIIPTVYAQASDYTGTKPYLTTGTAVNITYANGKFFWGCANGAFGCSVDGINWSWGSMYGELSGAGVGHLHNVYYKSGVYLNFQPNGTSTSALSSFTENASLFFAPDGRSTIGNGGTHVQLGTPFMKIAD